MSGYVEGGGGGLMNKSVGGMSECVEWGWGGG